MFAEKSEEEKGFLPEYGVCVDFLMNEKLRGSLDDAVR